MQDILNDKGRVRKSKHLFAFQGLIKCGYCGCSIIGSIAKGQYLYYHCTSNRGKCPGRYAKEEEIDKLYAQGLQELILDKEVLEWLKIALKAVHKQEKSYQEEISVRLNNEYAKLQSRIDKAYDHCLDGVITEEEFAKRSGAWRKEKEEILSTIQKHEKANRSYLEEGFMLLELTQHIVSLYIKQDSAEKRKLLQLVYSNSLWKDGNLIPSYRQPFDILIDMNKEIRVKKL